MSNQNDDVNAQDEATIQISVPIGPPTFRKVKVTSSDGVFKNGELHKEGSELVVETSAAKRFEENGDVEILGEADNPGQGNEDDES